MSRYPGRYYTGRVGVGRDAFRNGFIEGHGAKGESDAGIKLIGRDRDGPFRVLFHLGVLPCSGLCNPRVRFPLCSNCGIGSGIGQPSANQGKSGMPLYPAISVIISRQQYNSPSDLIIRYNSINQYTTLEILTVRLSYYIPYHQQYIPPDTGVRGYNQVCPPTTSATLTRPYIRLEVLGGGYIVVH